MDSARIDALLIPILPEELLLANKANYCSDDPIFENTSVTLDPGFFSSYEWRLKNDDILLFSDRLYTVSSPGIYEVTLSNGLTCLRDEILVTDECAPKIEAPTAFTPGNKDGLNDTFFVFPNMYVSDFQIYIYSRQGQLLFESNDINFRWDGVYKGVELQVGTYAYILRYKSTLTPNDGFFEQHGGVVLLK